MRRLCVGDIHGCYDKLMETLDKCRFSDSDILYSVGDFTDRGNQNIKTLNFLMSLKNFYPVAGNHDLWNYEYLSNTVTRDAFRCWDMYNGGELTYNEESKQTDTWRKKVAKWLGAIPYRIDLGDFVIIHSVCPKTMYEGIDVSKVTMKTLKPSGLITDEVYDEGVWNRAILEGCHDYQRLSHFKPTFDQRVREIYGKEFTGDPIYVIGHTPLDHPFYDKEMGIIGIDTGAFCTKKVYGIEGHLTILDLDSLEYWQSGKEGSFSL